MRRISVLAVVVGGIVDVGGSSLAGLPVVIYVMATANIVALPKTEQTAAVTAFIQAHAVVYAVLAAVGTLCSLLGGYVSALIARRSEVLNGALSSYLCLGFGIWALATGQEQMPTWLFLLLLPLSPIVAGLGGYLRLGSGPVLPNWALFCPVAPSDQRMKLPRRGSHIWCRSSDLGDGLSPCRR